MGDCGSMFIGFFLASSALLIGASGGRSREVFIARASPCRSDSLHSDLRHDFRHARCASFRAGRLAGRARPHFAPSGRARDFRSGGRCGCSTVSRDCQAFWRCWCAGETGDQLARHSGLRGRADACSASTLRASRCMTRRKSKPRTKSRSSHFSIDVSYKRRIFEVLLDVVLVILAYYTAYVLRSARCPESGAWRSSFGRCPFWSL